MSLEQDLMVRLYTSIKAVFLPMSLFAFIALLLIMSTAFLGYLCSNGYLVALAYNLRLI